MTSDPDAVPECDGVPGRERLPGGPPWVVTIDGPAGVGKTTIARRLASDLGWAHLDSGALYRALALFVLEADRDPSDEAAVGPLAESFLPVLDANARVRVGERDVSEAIRTGPVTAAVSLVAALPAVRTRMVEHQRAFAARHGRIVAEGRDMGTVVFPDATVKIYLDAEARERAVRRRDQESGGGDAVATESVLRDIEERDRRDRDREIAPLRPAEDAWRLETTLMTLDGVFEAVRSHVRSRIPVDSPPQSTP